MLDNFDYDKTPTIRWIEIVRNAGETSASIELERILEAMAVFQAHMEKNNLSYDALKSALSNDELEEYKSDLAIESMGNMLGKFE